MTRRGALRGSVLLLITLLTAGLAVPSAGEVHGDLSQFMRRKLELSKGVLEGLTVEDYALIARNAAELKALSMDAQWQVSPNPNYLRLSSDFQAHADDLARAAQARNLDGATLAHVQMTLTCVACHSLVRTQKLISLHP